MKLRRLTCLLLSLIFITSCSSEYEKKMAQALKIKLADSNPNPIFDGEAEPSIPNRSENDMTILGIDTNQNGIRDDVDIWINRTALDYNERMAMRQYARSEQEKLRVCSKGLKNLAEETVTESLSAGLCLDLFAYMREDKKISKYTFNIIMNTNQRKKCLGFFENNVSSYSTTSKKVKGNERHHKCFFDIHNIDDVIMKEHKSWGFKQ